MFDWRIGIGVCLKIGDIAVTAVFGAHKLFSVGELVGNRKRRGSGKIAGSALTAEDTASYAAGSVPVRAGTASI